ncbi:hypothetical protein NBRC116188_06080 [Oceaniserpentilla sp. 4NH20-0058]|uniref:hypothetical protein n=1 Tax=Oceaniserpentilla sp. 4NH20-0058 TaxID=3127660 RepID=UPI0031044349
MDLLILGVFLIAHFYISFLVCKYFAKFYDYELTSTLKAFITILTGPLTFALMMLVLFITPLSHLEAGIMDGGIALMFILFTPLFPIVSYFLVKSAHKFKLGIKYV